MRPLVSRLFFAAALLATSTARAQPQSIPVKCQELPALAGKCFTVHGRLYVSNGTPSVRLLKIGTKRILGASDEGDDLPACLRKFLAVGTFIYGDFFVCPLKPDRLGWMRPVCIELVSKLVLERYDDQNRPTVIIPAERSCRLGYKPGRRPNKRLQATGVRCAMVGSIRGARRSECRESGAYRVPTGFSSPASIAASRHTFMWSARTGRANSGLNPSD